MNMDKTYVSLTGGLGNQLFQFSAALKMANGHEVVLLNGYGKPREHVPGLPDICGFSTAESVRFETQNRWNVARKIASKGVNFTHSTGLNVSRVRNNKFVRRFSIWATSLIASLDLGTFVRVKSSRGVGFDQELDWKGQNDLLIGYYQSWKYIDRTLIKNKLGGAVPLFGGEWFEEMRELSNYEKPLVVHVRLGDYRNAPEFGFPSKEYFDHAITLLRGRNQESRIWLFSDEPQNALEFLPDYFEKLNARIVTPPRNASHPATAMAVMSLGKAFVLTNSTFGYWAAVLSGAQSSQIVIPDPWFEKLDPIIDFADPSWLRIPR